MSITVAWDNESRTVVRWKFEGKWGWQELHERTLESRTLVRSVTHTVHIIFDVREGSIVPANFFKNLRLGVEDRSPNRGLFIVVGGSDLVRSALNMFNQLFAARQGDRFKMVETLEEAYAAIAGQDGGGSAS